MTEQEAADEAVALGGRMMMLFLERTRELTAKAPITRNESDAILIGAMLAIVDQGRKNTGRDYPALLKIALSVIG